MTVRIGSPRDIIPTILVWAPTLAFVTFIVLVLLSGLISLEQRTYGTEYFLPNGEHVKPDGYAVPFGVATETEYPS